ncbi:MAG: toprim domain-containing protein [Deferribacteres bacterium]|nr:toprim domain-containing protein [Deferribacteres bacterium]
MNDFERVKDAIDLLNLIEAETGLKMKGHHLEECPFCGGHDCFSIKPDEQFFKCFQCDRSGDVYTFLTEYKGIEIPEALRQAAEFARINLTFSEKKKRRLTKKDRIFLDAAEYYHQQLHANGGSKYFVEQRKHSKEALSRMKVGWSNGQLSRWLLEKGYTREEILESGLAREKDGSLVDFFSPGLAIFPHFHDGKVLHITMKDPKKEKRYQLPSKVRAKDWVFYNQSALYRYKELIIVEGENDLLSVMGAGVSHVVGLIGQVSKDQIKALQKHMKGRHLYLWLDKDEGGIKQTRQICEALRGHDYNLRVVVHPGEAKDPDEFIKSLPEKDRRKTIRMLQEEALMPVAWEIALISRVDGFENRLKALKSRGVFRAVAEMVESEKLIYIEKLKALGLTEKAILEEIDLSRELLQTIKTYFASLDNKRDADPNVIASMIFKYFNEHGRFFFDKMDNVYLLYQHRIYTVGNNRPFNALMKKTTILLPTKEPGRSVWESLASDAYNNGRQIDLASWIHTDRNTDTIYVNLNSPNNMILKISAKGIEEIPNGLNKDGILLKSSRKILPVNFLPDSDMAEGLRFLKELVFDNLTCEPEQRYLIICWLMSAFLLDFTPYMALMKFSGASSSGKTTAARLLSLLIYGSDHLGDPSAAAAYAVASQNPLLIIDNLEHDDFTKSILKFLLLSATKGGKEKRTAGTESETTEEQPKALVLITAIEPFTKPELINRTYDIDFRFRFKSDDFVEDEVIREIIKRRDLMLSAIIKFLHGEVLPNLRERKDYINILKKEYRNHSKNRTDEFLSLLMVMLNRLLNYIPYYDEDHSLHGVETGEKEIRKRWIEYQDAKAKDTEVTSNNILKLLDGLVREYLIKMKDSKLEPEPHSSHADPVFVYIHPEYMLEVVKTQPQVEEDENGEPYTITYVEFIATSSEICQAFDRFCRNNGLRNPYEKASVFSARLSNDKHLLRKGGWEIISAPGKEPYFKIIKGQRYWKFRKTIAK